MKTKIILTILVAFVGFSFLLSCNTSETKQDIVFQNEHETSLTEEIPDSVYLNMGKKFAAGTQAVLGKNLVEAINKNGTGYAVEFCNTRAYPLTDSMAREFHAAIKRVSDQPRNPANQADASQLDFIKLVKKQIANDEPPQPKLSEIKGKMVGYYAITTNTMCLQCHGKKDINIEKNTLSKIQALYPADKATGYVENEVRGIWVVEMDKK